MLGTFLGKVLGTFPEHLPRALGAAALNFGDCFAYALAKTSGQSLLFKGTDFAATDLAAAL